MKFFGWGKSKDPQPQPVLQQVNKSDSRNGSHGLDRCKSLSGMGSIMPGKGSSAGIRKQQGLFGVVDDEEYLHSGVNKPMASSDDADSDEKLQDTIKFVFSHEREGLLAIGTFALEQLQSIRNTIDGHQKAAPEDGFDSSAAGASALDSDVMQSSDDEDQLQRKWLAARKTCDLPVFGDVDTSSVESEAERAPQEDHHQPDNSKALTLYNSSPNRTPVKPIVLSGLPPEIRKALDPATALLYGKSFLPRWTDSVPPPILAKSPAPFPDDDYYSSRLCGLFSKKKTLKSKRRSNQNEIVPVEGEEKKRMIPIELAQQETKKSLLKFASPGVPSLGKLARLWRATCKQSTARIAPERRPCPAKEESTKGQPCVANGVASGEVLTTPELEVMRLSSGRLSAGACSPKVAEFRKRVEVHERMVNAGGELRDGLGSSREDYGHWIKTDEDCKYDIPRTYTMRRRITLASSRPL